MRQARAAAVDKFANSFPHVFFWCLPGPFIYLPIYFCISKLYMLIQRKQHVNVNEMKSAKLLLLNHFLIVFCRLLRSKNKKTLRSTAAGISTRFTLTIQLNIHPHIFIFVLLLCFRSNIFWAQAQSQGRTAMSIIFSSWF